MVLVTHGAGAVISVKSALAVTSLLPREGWTQVSLGKAWSGVWVVSAMAGCSPAPCKLLPSQRDGANRDASTILWAGFGRDPVVSCHISGECP